MAVATNMTLGNVRLLRELKESEKEHMDPLVSPVIGAKNCPKTMESLEEHLRGDIGVKGVPLSYVVRTEETVAPSLYEPDTSFSSSEDEIVACAPIIEGDLRTVPCRNLLSIDSRLNQIDPSTNIIFLPNTERGYRTKF